MVRVSLDKIDSSVAPVPEKACWFMRCIEVICQCVKRLFAWLRRSNERAARLESSPFQEEVFLPKWRYRSEKGTTALIQRIRLLPKLPLPSPENYSMTLFRQIRSLPKPLPPIPEDYSV